jgi:CHRD domain
MSRLSVLAIALALVAVGCGSSTTTAPTALNPIFTATLLPANEVPPVTNAENVASGLVNITFNTTKDGAGNITSATATFIVTLSGFPAGSVANISHIHEGATTCACPVVWNTTEAPGDVTLVNGAGTFTKTAIAVADPAVAQRIISNPSGFYFNVHTTLNPGGAIRGTLVKVQ